MAALDLLTDERIARVKRLGDKLKQDLTNALSGSPLFRETRGAGFMQGILMDAYIPSFTWDIDAETGAITINSPHAPKEVTVHAVTTDPNLSGGRRDFRLLKGATEDDKCKFITVKDGTVCVNPVLWSSEDILPVEVSEGVYKYVIAKPIPKKGAYTAFFAEVKLPGADDSTEFVFTTQASILPNIYPFPMPKDNDKGVLV
jgi:hypothetical protein